MAIQRAATKIAGTLGRALIIGLSSALPLVAFEDVGWRILVVSGGAPALAYLAIVYQVQQYVRGGAKEDV